MVALVNEELRNSQLSRPIRRSALWELGAALGRLVQRMRENQQLAQLDARELQDIGLTQADVHMLLNKPIWRA